MSAPRTFIVVGVAKSGTSMAAGLLRLAGVHFGTTEEFGDYERESENMYLIDRVRTGDRQAIEEMNARYGVWGMKHPLLAGQLPWLLHACRNPHFVFCYRDVVAVAEHKRKGDRTFDPTVFAETMRQDLLTLQTMTEFAAARRPIQPPMLFVGYEKASRSPNDTVQRVVDFTGLEVSQLQRDRMFYWINPSAGYRSVREMMGHGDEAHVDAG